MYIGTNDTKFITHALNWMLNTYTCEISPSYLENTWAKLGTFFGGGQLAYPSTLTCTLLGLWIFHRLLGGVWTPPMISAPGRRRKNKKQRSKAREKLFRNHFGHFLAQVKIGSKLKGSKLKKNPKRVFDDKIFNFKGRATILIPSCLSRYGASNHI